MAWTPIVAKKFTVDAFDAYVRSLRWSAWKPKFIVLHNTATPSLCQRKYGLGLQHIRNLERYYRDQQGWSSGPHLFVDDLGIWVFTPLTKPGTHSPSWNRVSLGVEMLGNYERESFTTGRGAKVRENAAEAIASLSDVLRLDSSSLRLHKEDPKTTHDCPGKNVDKASFIRSVRECILRRRAEREA